MGILIADLDRDEVRHTALDCPDNGLLDDAREHAAKWGWAVNGDTLLSHAEYLDLIITPGTPPRPVATGQEPVRWCERCAPTPEPAPAATC